MESLSKKVNEVINETIQMYFEETGKEYREDPEQFIKWYAANHSAPFMQLHYDITTFYLKIPEGTVHKILKSIL